MIQDFLILLSQYKYIIQQNALQNKQYNNIDIVHFDDKHIAIVNKIYSPMLYRLDFLIDDFKCFYLRTEGAFPTLIKMPPLFNIEQTIIKQYNPRLGEIENVEIIKDLLTWINYPKGAAANANNAIL